MRRFSRSANTKANILIGLGIGILIGALAVGVAWSATGGGGDVRVLARFDEQGRAEVGVQQRQDDGWGKIQRPASRFLAANAEPGVWRHSSAVSLDGPDARRNVKQFGPLTDLSYVRADAPADHETLFCLVAHGDERDDFWVQVFRAAADQRMQMDLNLSGTIEARAEDQAAAIDLCVERGAEAIVTTLADPDALAPAIARAREAGVEVMSFQAGAQAATEVGSSVHIGLDDEAAGQMAAESFAADGVTGEIVCIVHEAGNAGLEQRCDALERNYTGKVVRLRVHDARSPEEVGERIVGAIGEDTGGALALNAETALAMVDGLHAAGIDTSGISLAAVGSDYPTLPAMLHSGRLSFIIWSQAAAQGFYAPATIPYIRSNPLTASTGFFGDAEQMLIQPQVVRKANIVALLTNQRVRAEVAGIIDELEQAIAAEPEQSR